MTQYLFEGQEVKVLHYDGYCRIFTIEFFDEETGDTLSLLVDEDDALFEIVAA